MIDISSTLPSGVVANGKASRLHPSNRAVRAHHPVLVFKLSRRHPVLVFFVDRCSVIRMDRLGPRVRIRIRAFAAATPDLLVCRADIQSAIAFHIDEEEYIADVLRYLTEQQLAGTQSFF